MSRRRGEITGLMNELPRLVAITIVRPTAASSLPILIFFVFFVLEASVSPKGASDAIGTQCVCRKFDSARRKAATR
jgi:hypothetical protein